MIDWAHAWPSVLASFLASVVEFVEALTIILAVGTVRGWRPALIGAGIGFLLLTVSVILFGPLLQRVPLASLQIVAGVLLLFFGMRWLRKAILRSAGVLKMHDEEAIYEEEVEELAQGAKPKKGRLDMVAVATTFKAVVIEGLEVVFIVIATGAVGHMIVPASIGAAAAGLVVILLGLAIHKPLSRVPENTLKFVVGLLLSSFGVFWLGEGLGFPWPGEDISLLVILMAFIAVSWSGVGLARAARRLA